ncbi:Fic family protein [Candidatus Pacearchaeota archaeon]|nr:Fic family protein [Candidatus Pacearchaeota archaeon]
MEPEEFNGKLGKLIQANKKAYSTFEPNLLPLKINYDEELIRILAEAIASISNLSGMGRRLRNPHLLIMPYLKKEAVLSSEIEGTRTSLSEILLEEKAVKKSRDEDLKEVNNYIQALGLGLKEMDKKIINEKLIKRLHYILMKSVRGENKEPGKYKTHQNHIGGSLDIFGAKFVPASPETTPNLMENLIEYINNSKRSTNLIKAGILHYQFETIHPFRDGNGRIGRLLISLFLCKTKTLSQPLLYLSAYFKKHQREYNQRLFEVSSQGKIENWLKFFFKAIKIQSDEALERTIQLDNYYEEARQTLEKNSSSTNALLVLDSLFENPFIKITEIEKILNCRHPTAKNNLNILIKNKILTDYTPKRIVDKIFYSPKISEILELENLTIKTKR